MPGRVGEDEDSRSDIVDDHGNAKAVVALEEVLEEGCLSAALLWC